MENNFLVCVRCMTYNHAPYIEDAMDGFMMQQTNFPFVCCIIDDASTDGEPEIIKKHLQQHFDLENKDIVRNEETEDYTMTFAQHKTNKNCYFAVYFLKYNHYSIKKDKISYIKEWLNQIKYIALCEGDDYWIDYSKLQNQYNSLESNPQAVMIYTGFKTVDEKGNYIQRPFYQKCMEKSHSGDCLATLYDGSYIMTLTKFLKKEVYYTKAFVDCPAKYDYSLDLAAAIMGDFIYLPEKTGCYRKTPTGTMATNRGNVNIWNDKAYQYFSDIILSGETKKISIKNSIIIRLHILVHSLITKDRNYVKEIIEKDFGCLLLFPFAYIYSMTK